MHRSQIPLMRDHRSEFEGAGSDHGEANGGGCGPEGQVEMPPASDGRRIHENGTEVL
jgi:hypothetical protein